jgi:hypothetical protein
MAEKENRWLQGAWGYSGRRIADFAACPGFPAANVIDSEYSISGETRHAGCPSRGPDFGDPHRKFDAAATKKYVEELLAERFLGPPPSMMQRQIQK